MIRSWLVTITLYVSVGIVSLTLALMVASRLLRPVHSQTPQEVTASPPPPASPPKDGSPLPPTTPSASTPAVSEEKTKELPVADVGKGKEKHEDPIHPDSKNVQTIDGFLQSFNYDGKNRRDPFVAPIDRPVTGPFGPVLPLQYFDLEQLRLTAIIWSVQRPKAMVRDPSGKVHIVVTNDKVGKNNGYVAVIREGEIVVVEPTQDENQVSYTTKLLKLAK